MHLQGNILKVKVAVVSVGGGGTLNTKFKMKHCLLPKQYFSLYPHYGMQPQLVSLKVEK